METEAKEYVFLPTTCVSDAQNGLKNMHTNIKPLLEEYKICGPAHTVSVLANDNLAVLKGIRTAKPGDILVVDRSLTPVNGKVVIAILDGQFTVKTLEKKRGKIRLLPANPEFEPIELKDEQELQVWGVVTKVIHSL